jgi:hypothetical protein
MKRRAFITLLGGTAAAPSLLWPLAARAQQDSQARRIGVLMAHTESDPEFQNYMNARRFTRSPRRHAAEAMEARRGRGPWRSLD